MPDKQVEINSKQNANATAKAVKQVNASLNNQNPVPSGGLTPPSKSPTK